MYPNPPTAVPATGPTTAEAVTSLLTQRCQSPASAKERFPRVDSTLRIRSDDTTNPVMTPKPTVNGLRLAPTDTSMTNGTSEDINVDTTMRATTASVDGCDTEALPD